MRHHRKGGKLQRKPAHRDALVANLAASLIEHGQIKTTLGKAKALRPFAEKLVTLGKKDTVHARRRAAALLKNQSQRQSVVSPSSSAASLPHAPIAKVATPASPSSVHARAIPPRWHSSSG